MANYLAASPVALVAPPVFPFFIQHGALDVGATRGEVPIGISGAFADRLRACGGVVEFTTVERAKHGFMTMGPQGPHVPRAMEAALAFLQKHLVASRK